MKDNTKQARDLLAARREHSKGQGNFPTPEPHMDLRDERPEDRNPRDLPKAKDDRSAPKGDVTAGQEERNPELETRVPRGGGREPNPPGGMELVEREVELLKSKARPARPNARRSSAAKRDAMRDERPRKRGRIEPGTAAKDAGPDATQSTAQGGKKASRRTSAGRGRAGRR